VKNINTKVSNNWSYSAITASICAGVVYLSRTTTSNISRLYCTIAARAPYTFPNALYDVNVIGNHCFGSATANRQMGGVAIADVIPGSIVETVVNTETIGLDLTGYGQTPALPAPAMTQAVPASNLTVTGNSFQNTGTCIQLSNAVNESSITSNLRANSPQGPTDGVGGILIETNSSAGSVLGSMNNVIGTNTFDNVPGTPGRRDRRQ
jgi:hypothetical protein